MVDLKGKGKAVEASTLDASAEFIAFDWEEEQPVASSSSPKWSSEHTRLALRDSKSRKDDSAFGNLTPWADLVRWDDCRDPAEMLHYEVLAFVDTISATPEEHEVRRLVVELIRRCICDEWPDAEVHAFGSYGTRLYLPSSDLDLVAMIPDAVDIPKLLKKIGKEIERRQIGRDVQVVGKAKVPIVKFKTLIGNFFVDISINQPNGLRAMKLINGFLAQYPALRYLVIVVKCFLAQRSLNEVYTGGLSSYSIVCLVLSFLQMHPKIRNAEIDPMDNLGVLLVEFFELYGHYFNTKAVGVSLQNGGSYYDKLDHGFLNPGKESALSIEDPQLESNDVSAGSFEMPRIRRAMASAFESLTAVMIQRDSEIQARRNRKHVRLGKGAPPPSARSILGCILGISDEMISRRRINEEIYWDGALHHKLVVPHPGPPPAIPVHDEPEPPTPAAESVKTTDLSSLSAAKAVPGREVHGNSDIQLHISNESSLDASPVATKHRRSSDEDAEDDSRYGAVRAAKRRKTDEAPVVHDVEDISSDEDVDHRTRSTLNTSSGMVPTSSSISMASEVAAPRRVDGSDRKAYWGSKVAESGLADDHVESPGAHSDLEVP